MIHNKGSCTVLCTVPNPFRCFISKVQVDDKVHVYVLVNIHALNKKKTQLNSFKKLHTLLQTENLDSEENIIVVGRAQLKIKEVE